MNPRTILFYTLAVLMGGCGTVSTLHPLQTDKNLTFDERLLGVWAEDANEPEQTWTVERFEDRDPNFYKLTLVDDDDKKGIFEMRLFKLGGDLYIDLAPAVFPSGKEDIEDEPYPYNGFHFARLHTFAMITSVEPNLVVGMTEEDELEKLLQEKPDAVAHTFVEDDKLIVTASTEQLQAFVLKYKTDERLFSNTVAFRRIKIGAPGSADCSTAEGQKSN